MPASAPDGDVAAVREAIRMVHQEALLRDARLLVQSASQEPAQRDQVDIRLERSPCVEWRTGSLYSDPSQWVETPPRRYPNDPPSEDLTGGRTERACFMVHMTSTSDKDVADACKEAFRVIDADKLVLTTYPVFDLYDKLEATVLGPGQSCRGTFGFRYRSGEHPTHIEYRGNLLASGVKSFDISALPPTTVPNPLGVPVPDEAVVPSGTPSQPSTTQQEVSP